MILKYSYFKKSSLITKKKIFLFYGPNFGKIEDCVQFLKDKLSSYENSLKFLSFFQRFTRLEMVLGTESVGGPCPAVLDLTRVEEKI